MTPRFAPSIAYSDWPSLPPSPDALCDAPHPCALVRLPHLLRSPSSRAHARLALSEILRSWLGHSATWRETPLGPSIQDQWHGLPLYASLSYGPTDVWIGLSLHRPIGVDAVSLSPFEGWESVEALYLRHVPPPLGLPAQTPAFVQFALRWATLESSLKCTQASLQEDLGGPLAPWPASLQLQATLTPTTALALALHPVETLKEVSTPKLT